MPAQLGTCTAALVAGCVRTEPLDRCIIVHRCLNPVSPFTEKNKSGIVVGLRLDTVAACTPCKQLHKSEKGSCT